MASVTDSVGHDWTAADLVARFGAVPLHRLRHDPPPGAATEGDLVKIHDREDRLYELADGVLMEKTVGTYESYLAGLLVRALGNHVAETDAGIVLPADGMLRLAPGLVRIPDVSFISWQRLPGRNIPRDAIAELSPDLAIEVISQGNTREEMERKLREYFAASVRQVWYVYPSERHIKVYHSPEKSTTVGQDGTLEASDVLPGFRLELAAFFSDPPARQCPRKA